MAIIYACSMDHYGDSAGTSYDGGNGQPCGWELTNDVMLGDGWSAFPELTGRPNSGTGSGNEDFIGLYSIGLPSFGARRGDRALIADGVNIRNTFDNSARVYPTTGAAFMFVIPGASAATRHIHVAFAIDQLPTLDVAHGGIVDLFTSTGDRCASIKVNPTGRLSIFNGDSMTWEDSGLQTTPTVLATSASPVISAGTWYSLNILLTNNGADHDVDVYVGDIDAANLAISANGLAFSNNANIDLLGFLPVSAGGDSMPIDDDERAIRDLVISDTTGTYNNAGLGQVFVSAQEMRGADAGGGWGVESRENYSDGILDAQTNNTGIRLPDTPALDIGTQDFTLESMFRFNTIPDATVGQEYDLISRWRTNTDERSYRLYFDGSTGSLKFDISTDGLAVTTIKDIPWDVEKWKWYHVAVSRWTDTSGTYTSLFVNGVELGVPTADTNDYFDATAALGVAARFDGTSTLVTDSAFDGWLDETRVTIGTGRYTADFTPPSAKFGRNVSDDTEFNNVVLLMGYETTIADESSAGRTVSVDATDPVTAQEPDDGDFDYQVLNRRPPWDDTYVEATNYFAQSILTLLANPTASETMTIGSQTYTFVSSLTGADEILIGADIDETLDNITAAVNGGTGEGSIYGTGTTANVSAVAVTYASPELIIRAISAGASTVATTETMANGEFDGATLSGGTDIPADNDFQVERLPIDATGVLGVQMTAQVAKSDAGSVTMRFDLVGPSAGVAAGSDKNFDLTPTWVRQIFEEDPDTSASITPSTIVAGRIRFKRTS